MVVAYQNRSETKVLGTSCNVSVPAGFSPGDLLIAVTNAMEGAISRPPGWTVIQSVSASYRVIDVSYRIAQAGDTNWTWTGSNTVWIGEIHRYTGHDATTPIHASEAATSTSGSAVAPSVAYTSLGSGSLVLQVGNTTQSGNSLTVPAPLTSRYSTYNYGLNVAGGDKSASGTGSTGTADFNTQSGYWVCATVVVNVTAPPGVAPTSIFIGPFGGPFGGPIQ